MKQRKEAAYNQYKGTWKETLTHITEVVKDEEALNGMSQDEKITYALALESYFEEKEKNASFGAEERKRSAMRYRHGHARLVVKMGKP